jgi:flagellar export protein FliJ
MAFRFPLATVLRLRESLERKEQLALEMCYQQLAAAQRRLSEVDGWLEYKRKEYENQLLQGTSGVELQFQENERQRMENFRETVMQQIAEAQARLRQQMEMYRTVRQHREVITELRKAQFEKYRRQESLQEQKTRDDLFLLRRQRAR